jgi:DNA mismatch repair ATPase MutS
VQGIFDSVSSRNNDVRHYWRLFEMIAELPDECLFLARLQASVGQTPREPLVRLASLMRIMSVANLRRAGLLGIPYIASQLMVLTDFHLLSRLEAWQRKHGRFVRRWFDAVAQLEAVSSLATLSHDHPEWVFPVVDASEANISAQALGHPLLSDDMCVRNDVVVGPKDSFLLVTGSNMSGKSTLLRSIGVNVVLAQAGGPVCATEFHLPPLQIATSMRVHDSLADGVSFFMAELKRMKQIVDQSRELQHSGERQLLYLLDEILQGTNSAERQIAVSRIINYLVAHGAIGAVSTHDLELASVADLAKCCQMVHFRETIVKTDDQQKMTFDYKVRQGLSPTTNALKLLEIVGLSER